MWTIYVFPVKLNEYGIAYWSAAPYGSTSCTCVLRCVSRGCWRLSECKGGPVFRNLCLGLGCGGGPHCCTVPHGPAVLPHFFPHFCPRPPPWWPAWRWEHCCGLGGHMRGDGVRLLCPPHHLPPGFHVVVLGWLWGPARWKETCASGSGGLLGPRQEWVSSIGSPF